MHDFGPHRLFLQSFAFLFINFSPPTFADLFFIANDKVKKKLWTR
jgi:hypothetical protein